LPRSSSSDVLGTWAVALANVQATFGLSDGQLGILLAVSIAWPASPER